MRGSGWFYSGYSGFHPNIKEKNKRERNEKLKEREKKNQKKS